MFSCLFKDDIDFILIIVNHYKTFYFGEREKERWSERVRECIMFSIKRVRVGLNCQSLPRNKNMQYINNRLKT